MKLQIEVDLDNPDIEGDAEIVALILNSVRKVIEGGCWGEDIRKNSSDGRLYKSELQAPNGVISARVAVCDAVFDAAVQIKTPAEQATLTDPTTPLRRTQETLQ